ncbi:MAG TPA: malate synthase A, partial [Symbiobacteriaceae bacterium]|nr:malate synthase A [Symbiobacteriaceae bacterium]
TVTADLVRTIVAEEVEKIRQAVGEQGFGRGRYQEARDLFEQVALADTFTEFLTIPAYQLV